MCLKYSSGVRVLPVLCLAGGLLFVPQFFCASTTCRPPDFPEGGNYTPMYTEYEVGMKVTYHCKDRFKRFGADRTTCLTTGRWSEKPPFCDSPVKLKNPTATTKANLTEPSAIIDGSPNSCFQTNKSTDGFVRVLLDRPAAVHAVIIYLLKGKYTFSITLSADGHMNNTACESYNAELAERDWVPFFCKSSGVKAKYITIQANGGKASAVSLCELQVYAKDDDWCQNSPENYIPNGQLQVSRNRADFKCNAGFKAKDKKRVYATCESNKWSRLLVQCEEILCLPITENPERSAGIWDIDSKISKLSVGTKSSLKCKEGFHTEGEPLTVTCLENGKWNKTSATCKKTKVKKDVESIIAIAVGSVVVIVIFILLGLTIFFIRKKNREVVVIYKPGEDNSYSVPPSVGGHSVAGLSEAEYSTVYYEAIQNNQFDPRAVPPKPPNLVPKLDRGYSKPVDDRSPYNTAPTNRNPTDLAFGTLTKSSSLYSTMN